jgi:iron complex transport system substrate-binding protein
MKHFLPILIAIVAMPALAETVTDDGGRDVAMPDKIERVIGLHDAIITAPLYELGFDVVGSNGRENPSSGEWELFGFQRIFGTTAREAGIANIGGHNAIDLEVVHALAPDLIVTTEGSEKQAEMLEIIAPVYQQRSFTGDVYGISAEASMATRFGTQEKFDTLHAVYMERVADIRNRLPYDPAERTYTAIMVFDEMNVMNGLSGLMQATADLGFQQPEWVKKYEQTGFLVPLSPEELDRIDSDLVMILPGYSNADQSAGATRALMDGIAPGWDRFLQAEVNGNVLFMEVTPILTPTVASAHLALDALEAHLFK